MSSSARNTSKSSRSQPAKERHGMTLRSNKKGSVDDLCEIFSQHEKETRFLRAKIKRVEAVVAAKDSKLEAKVSELEAKDRELEAKDRELEKALSLVALLRERENTDRATANTSFEVPEEQIPQGSGEQTVETSRPEIYGFEEVSPFNTRMVRRRDMYGPEVEDSLGMVRNGTTSPVAADNSHQVVAMDIDMLSQTATGESPLEDPADNSFEIYEDPDTENLVEEQGSPAGPSGSFGRMPLGERECDGTISRNLKQFDKSATPKSKQTPKSSTIPFNPLADITEAHHSKCPTPLPCNVSFSGFSPTVRSRNFNMDQDARTLAALHGVDLEPATCEDPDTENEEQFSPVGPSSSGRMPLDMPTTKTSRGKKRTIEEDEDNQSRKKFRD